MCEEVTDECFLEEVTRVQELLFQPGNECFRGVSTFEQISSSIILCPMRQLMTVSRHDPPMFLHFLSAQ